MNRLFYILLCLLTPTILDGQYLIPDSSVLRINKVKKLTVINCLDSSFCFTDEFDFNKKGQMTKEAPGIVEDYSTWDFYDNGLLKTSYTKIHPASNGDSILKADHYHYDTNWKFKCIISDQYQYAKIVSTDTIFILRLTKMPESKHNQKGQVTEQELGDLHFPCAIVFKGRHKIYYEYYDNGLLINAKVIDETEKLIISFAYNYDYY